MFFTFYHQGITIIFWKGVLKFRYKDKTFSMRVRLLLSGPNTVADVTLRHDEKNHLKDQSSLKDIRSDTWFLEQLQIDETGYRA